MKTTIKKILFPTDFSKSALNAFKYALWFASKTNASIELWHFVNPEIAVADLPMLSGENTRKRIEIAKEVIKTFREAGIREISKEYTLEELPRIQSHTSVGGASNLISKKAKTQDCDIIIMGTQGEHNTLQRIMGSVTTSTISKAPCPVLAIPDNTSLLSISKVAYATELLKTDPLHIWQATKLLSPLQPKYSVVHAADYSDKKASLELETLETYFKDHKPSTLISFYSLYGDDIIDLLDKFITNRNIDLMIMYRSKKNLFKRIFQSSMTRSKALHTSIPLLIVK